MTDPHRPTGSTPERREGIPRWLKVTGVAAVLVAVLVVVLVLAFGGDGGHGPSRHGQASGPAAQTTTPEVRRG